MCDVFYGWTPSHSNRVHGPNHFENFHAQLCNLDIICYMGKIAQFWMWVCKFFVWFLKNSLILLVPFQSCSWKQSVCKSSRSVGQSAIWERLRSWHFADNPSLSMWGERYCSTCNREVLLCWQKCCYGCAKGNSPYMDIIGIKPNLGFSLMRWNRSVWSNHETSQYGRNDGN